MHSEKYHFIGIGGICMSGLAHLLLQKNKWVSGSDISTTPLTIKLENSGAIVHLGHSAANIEAKMRVVYNTDIKKDNPELQAASALNCICLHRSEMLQELMKAHTVLAVAGTHGKTTTASLLTWVLECCQQSPSYMIGGIIPQMGSSANYGSGIHFVAEACESDGTFLNYTPYGAIVTNIGSDHMDYHQNEENLHTAFHSFMKKVLSLDHLFWCGDDSKLKSLNPTGISYGFSESCQLKISNFSQQQWSISFDICLFGQAYSSIEVALIGKHNALNAAAVFGLALQCGLSEEVIRQGLATFQGVLRRCEKKGEEQGVLFLDDYGHHPTELQATLKGIRAAIGERRLIVLYQPHRYTRSKTCMGLYGNVFEEVDILFITEIYAASEPPIEGISHEQIIAETKNGQFVSRSMLVNTLLPLLRPHDVVITLGAGDITKAADEIIEQMVTKPISKLKVALISGGVSVEHEISKLSVKNIEASLNPAYYDVNVFYIDNSGFWTCLNEAMSEPYSRLKISGKTLELLSSCDICFPVLHGTYGEDGTVQGFFELLGLAYVGCDYRSAALCMDKITTKRLMLNEGINTSDFVHFHHYEWQRNKDKCLQKIRQLHYPLFVKPSHLGSSIGVHKVTCFEALELAIQDAFRFDTTILVENGILGRELEFAVLGNDNPIVFPPGEILADGQLYGYQEKYGTDAIQTTPKADLPKKMIDAGLEFVKKAYVAAGCIGMARVDTFLDKDEKFWLNEINPIPGFTKNSLYPQMCEVNGLKAIDLIDQLIILGLHRRRLISSLEMRPFK